MGVFASFVLGTIIGLVSGAVTPGQKKLGLGTTMLLGIAGAIAGGIVGSALARRDVSSFQTAGFLGSLLGAIVLLIAVEMVLAPRRRMV